MISRIVLASVIALGFAGILSSCNTMEGFGEDVKNTGAAIERKAED